MLMKSTKTASLAVILSVCLLPVAQAGCACSAGGTWDPFAFLNYDPLRNPDASSEAKKVDVLPYESRSSDFVNGRTLKSMSSVSASDTLLAISLDSELYAKGSLRLDLESLLYPNGTLRSPEEIASALSSIGISQSDRIVVYSDDIRKAALGFFALRYVGHEDLSLLDGDLDKWRRSGLPVDSLPAERKPSEYKPRKQDLIATYDYIKSGGAQIVDARPFQDFGVRRIPNAIHIDSERLIKDDRIAENTTLKEIFSSLLIDRPVVVYSEELDQAALVWFALQLMGYNATLYSWKDWISKSETSIPQGALGHARGANTASGESRFKRLG